MRCAAVILAAGRSSRMGREKALLPWPNATVGPSADGSQRTLLQAIVASARNFAQSVIVVVGENRSAISSALSDCNVEFVTNPHPDRGMFSSLQCGLAAALESGADAALIFHVDRPPVRPETLKELLLALANEPACVASIPSYRGVHGHPYALKSKTMHAFVAAPPHSNARQLMKDLGEIRYFQCDDPAITANLNTPADYGSLTGIQLPDPGKR